MSLITATALELAGEIAAELHHTAHVYEGECTWMGTVQAGGVRSEPVFTYEALGPDLYGGTAGVALFLAHWYSHSGEATSASTAIQAARFATARLDRVPHKFRRGFYSGRLGIAFALARVGTLLGAEEFRDIARREVGRQLDDNDDDILLDVISGAAGSVGAVLSLAVELDCGDFVLLAERLGDQIIASAQQNESGWSWGDNATGFATRKPLTGLGHGAAGMGCALLELFDATGHYRYRDAAREAFRYEASLFSAAHSNWPDLRFTSDASDAGGHFGVAWCLGAPGIGLTRVRACALDAPTSRYETDIAAALSAVERFAEAAPDLGNADFSLCHGWAGIGDFLLSATRRERSALADRLLETIVTAGGAVHRGNPGGWHCGMQRGSTPSLLLGLAGIGHFLLRVGDPSVPSVLLVHPENTPPRAPTG